MWPARPFAAYGYAERRLLGHVEEVRVIVPEQQQPDREHVYGVLRREIVNGTIAPEQALSSAGLNARFGSVGRVAQEVLATLEADGYLKLKMSQGGYMPEHWSDDEVAELLEQLMLLHEICTLRMPEDGPQKIEELRRWRVEFELGQSDETRFLALLNWIVVSLTARQRSAVAQLAAKLIPSAILRIMWAAVVMSPEVGPAMAAIEAQIAAGDRRASRARVSEFWEIALRCYSELRPKSAAPISANAHEIREPALSGKLTKFGRADRLSTELLPRLANNPRRSNRLPQ